MGNILKLLSREETSSSSGSSTSAAAMVATTTTCCTNVNQHQHDVFVDFENSTPNAEEADLYNEAQAFLAESDLILKYLSCYKGATNEIRDAIARPSLESELEAWRALMPLVAELKRFYDFSGKLENLIEKLLDVICGPHPDGLSMRTWEQLDYHQALVKQFAKCLEFVLKADEYKMLNPALQNDFSYFRRTSQRLIRGSTSGSSATVSEILNLPSYKQIETEVPLTVANDMSMFFANATPVLHALTQAITRSVKARPEDPALAGRITDTLSVMAKVCQKMLDIPELKSRIKYEETKLFILRVMVALIILYDHVHPVGAFAKGSSVDIKGCIRVLKDHGGGAEGLFNALRYTTKHLNDNNTPKSTKSIVFEDPT